MERFEVTKEENGGRQVKDFTCKYLVLQGVFESQGKMVKPPFKDSKSVVPQGTVGSNPTPSASKNKHLGETFLKLSWKNGRSEQSGRPFPYHFPQKSSP